MRIRGTRGLLPRCPIPPQRRQLDDNDRVRRLGHPIGVARPPSSASVKAVDGVDLDIARRRDLRLPRPERRRQVDDRAHAVHAARPDRAAGRRSPASTSPPSPAPCGCASASRSRRRPSTPKQTGAELLRLQGLLYGLSQARGQRRVGELGELIDLGDALDRPIGTYSGGMQRRLDLAAALVHNPEVLFLDEPTTGLDPVSRARVWEEVRRLNDELGMTIFLTTQYLEEADELADRVGIIDARPHRRRGHADRAQAVGRHRRHRRPRRRRRAPPCARRSAAVAGVHGVEAHGNELVIVDRATARRRSARSPSPSTRVRRRGPRPHAAHADARRRVPRADRHPHPHDADDNGTEEAEPMTVADDHRSPTAGTGGPRARPAGLRPRRRGDRRPGAARRPPRPRGGDPAGLHRPVLLHREHRHAVRTSPSRRSPASTSRRSRWRRRSCSASPACPGRRRSCSTCRTATSTGCCSRRCGGWRSCSATWSPTSPWPSALTIPILVARLRPRRPLRDRPARRARRSSLLAALWSLAFAGFGYAIALKTGNPAAVNSSFLLFFPFLFLTSSYVPRDAAVGLARHGGRRGTRSPTCSTACGRSSCEGWEWDELGQALLAIAIVGAVSMSLCFAALRGRIRRG